MTAGGHYVFENHVLFASGPEALGYESNQM